MKKTPYYSVSKLFRQRDNPLIEDIYLKRNYKTYFLKLQALKKQTDKHEKAINYVICSLDDEVSQ